MTIYSTIQTITEITVDHSNPTAVHRINAHLKMGWIILDIHKRGYDYTNEGETARYFTVYILGHSDVNAAKPVSQDSVTQIGGL